MSRITWDALGERIYEIGLDHGVLYLTDYSPENVDGDPYTIAVPWNGLTKVTNPVLNDDSNPLYYGGTVVDSTYSSGAYSGTIEAITYPPEFESCIGVSSIYPGIEVSRQDVITFGLSYRTLIANDTEGTDKGYIIHLLYNARIPKFTKSYATMSDSLEVEPLTWDYESFPETVTYIEVYPVYHLAINSLTAPSGVIRWLENLLYGTETTEPRLPVPDEIFRNYNAHYDAWYGYPSPGIFPSTDKYPFNPETPGS